MRASGHMPIEICTGVPAAAPDVQKVPEEGIHTVITNKYHKFVEDRHFEMLIFQN